MVAQRPAGLAAISPVSNLGILERFYMGPLNTPRPAATVVQLAHYRTDHRADTRAAPLSGVPALRQRRRMARSPAGATAPAAPPSLWAQAAQARARARAEGGAVAAPAVPAATAVRVTRFAEAANANTHGPVRHLRICGRLGDVCAELDRLVAAEARCAALPRRA